MKHFKIVQTVSSSSSSKSDESDEEEYMPDLICIKNAEYNPNYALFGIDFRKISNLERMSEYSGQLLYFNTRVLEFNKDRKLIVSMVTNLDFLRLVISQKISGEITHTNNVMKVNVEFWTFGLQYIRVVNDNPSLIGYESGFNTSIEINRFLKL